MKKLFLLFSMVLTLGIGSTCAQTFDEWFKQKKTQKRYLLQQIIQLKIFLGNLKKGYDIVDKGLSTISDIKNDSFTLDRDYFNSLKNVKPAIRNSAKVADIIALELDVIRDMKKVYDFSKKNENFKPEEIQYIAKVHDNMLFLCDASISELSKIIDDNKTEMTDDQRILKIDKIHEDTVDKYAFVETFGNEIYQLAKDRESEKHEVDMLKKNFDLL